MSRFRLVAIVTLSLLVARGGFAPPDAEGAPDSPATFGTASEVVHTVGAWDFDTFDGDATATNFGDRRCTGGPCTLLANVRLPSGALVSRIELDACDANAGNQIFFTMRRISSPGTAASLVSLAPNGGTGGAPGCALFPLPLLSPETIDNKGFTYTLRVTIGIDAGDLSFSAVRVYYTLQVSPAPGTATFGDVPTSHPFFPFIEALVASGVTAGCSAAPPLYCPDAALTRGQMAVFLGKALGLHFAP